MANGMPVYVPCWLQSGGLTNTPNWPALAPLVNSASVNSSSAGDAAMAAVAGDATQPTTPNPAEGYNPTMNLTQRLAGVTGADLKTDDDCVAHVSNMHQALNKVRTHLKSRWDAERAVNNALPVANEAAPEECLAKLFELLDGKIANSKKATDDGAVALANAATAQKTAEKTLADTLQAFRTAAAAPVVDAAIRAGVVLPANREAALAPLVNAATPEDFAKAAEALANTKPLMKVAGRANADNKREQAVGTNYDKILSLVNEAMKGKASSEYDQVFDSVRKAHPELFPTEK
jgi:hypothetical protein